MDSLLDLSDQLVLLCTLRLPSKPLVLSLLSKYPDFSLNFSKIDTLANLIHLVSLDILISIRRYNLQLVAFRDGAPSSRLEGVDGSHVRCDLHILIIRLGLQDSDLVGETCKLLVGIAFMCLKLFSSDCQVLVALTILRLLLAQDCFNISVKFGEKRFTHCSHLALTLRLGVDDLKL